MDSELDSWVERSVFWKSVASQSAAKRKKRSRRTEPLILCGHGVSLKIRNGALLIEDGVSHANAEPDRYLFHPGELDIPERIVLVESAGALTLAALRWLGEQGVTLIDVDWRGRVASVIGRNGIATDRDSYLQQIALRASPEKRLQFSADLIRRKLVASIETLEAVFKDSPKRYAAIETAKHGINKIDANDVADIDALLGVEGLAAVRYYAAWEGLQLKWKGIGRNPVPKPWLTYSQRSSVLTGRKAKNWKADHPINAMLNYGYAVLESHTYTTLIANGQDPMAGVYHERKEGTPSFALDIMEPDRPRVDRAVLEFALSHTFSVKDFYLRKDGVCRLSPELARAVAGIVAKALNA